MPTLKLALIHLAIRHKQPAANRQQLLDLFGQAGEAGADLIIAPELALSGYSFASREDIDPYTETAAGPTLTALAALTRRFGCYGCVGLAERDPAAAHTYNSAFILSPDGALALRYRKIIAEKQWASPGDPYRDNTLATDWGRIGVLICSDSYSGLLARATALRGADLLLVLSNWPPFGMDPRELWRARALENGCFVAACNRTGPDLTMDFSQASSLVLDPSGQTMAEVQSPDSRLCLVELPLKPGRRLSTAPRLERLGGSGWPLNPGGDSDRPGCLQPPPPGNIELVCMPAGSEEQALDMHDHFRKSSALDGTVQVLSSLPYQESTLEHLRLRCAQDACAMLLSTRRQAGCELWWFDRRSEPQRWFWHEEWGWGSLAPPWVECGGARILLAPPCALRHPEMILSGARQGCDLALISEQVLTPQQKLLAGARSIDQLAMAVCARNEAGIWLPPVDHQRWGETLAKTGACCRWLLDTRATRRKRLPDRIDCRRLLANQVKKDPS